MRVLWQRIQRIFALRGTGKGQAATARKRAATVVSGGMALPARISRGARVRRAPGSVYARCGFLLGVVGRRSQPGGRRGHEAGCCGLGGGMAPPARSSRGARVRRALGSAYAWRCSPGSVGSFARRLQEMSRDESLTGVPEPVGL